MTDLVSAVVATLVAAAFGLSTFERYLARRARQELAWSVALLLFALASGALAVGAADSWSGPTYRVFFLFGGIVNVPVLALGTVYLLTNRKVGDICAAGVGLFAAFSAGAVVVTPFAHRLPHDRIPQASHVLPGLCEVLAGIGSGLATVVIVGGAIYSIVVRRGRRTTGANVLIAVGTLVTGASGIANSAFDQMTAFAVFLGVGIAIIFVGFLVASPPLESKAEHRHVTDRSMGRPLSAESAR